MDIRHPVRQKQTERSVAPAGLQPIACICARNPKCNVTISVSERGFLFETFIMVMKEK